MADYKFLLYISYRYGIPIGAPLEKEILERGYQVKWFTYIPETRNYIPKESEVLESIREVIAYQPDIILTIADYVPDFLPGLKVQVFHGFNPEKREGDEHFRIRGFFDLYCTQGPATTRKFLEQQKKYRHFEVVETGWPKMDSLFTIPESRQHPIPVVMITSTFSHRLSLALREEVFEEIRRLSHTGKYDFIAVLHPKLPVETIEEWKSLQSEHFTFFDTADLNPLFRKADILFADTTSAIQEFMLTRKPVVTYCHHLPNPCLINVTQPDKIEEALDYALTNPPEIMTRLKKAAGELHPYADGKSSMRVIDAAIRFLHQDKSGLKKKPLNIIRKYKIRKMLNYFTLKSYRRPYRQSPD